MMRFIRMLILFVLIAGVIYYIYDINDFTINEPHEEKEQQKLIRKPEQRDFKKTNDVFKGDIYGWMGQDQSELKDAYGEPVRKDKSIYGFTWWIYNDLEKEYVQFGLKNNKVQTIYITGENASLHPLSIKEKYKDVQKDFSFKKEIKFTKDNNRYTFHLTDNDLKHQPLIKVNDDLFIQIYMDVFEDRLAAVRVVTADVLLSLTPYKLTYQGDLPGEKEWSNEEWENIQAGMELQIFDITNALRRQFEKGTLEWNDDLHSVALSHSKDMLEQDYFSHVAPNGDGLSERLMKNDIGYQSAGENIAADYIDAPAAVVGWLNSEGHRKIMLDSTFTKLGVGVYRNYFTQNYLK